MLEVTDVSVLFNETNPNYRRDPITNQLFLKSVLSHYNTKLELRGVVLLNELYYDLGFPRTRTGAIVGWQKSAESYVDIIQSLEMDGSIKLDFNVDGIVIDYLPGGNLYDGFAV